MPNLYANFVGIDVSKDKLDVYETQNNKFFSCQNNEKEIKKLMKKFAPSPNLLVAIDLTGGYEKLAAKLFAQNNFNVALLQGLKVKHFARSYSQKAKTDKIDAKMLAIYADKMRETLKLYKYNSDEELLKKLHSRLCQLQELLQKENTRAKCEHNAIVKRSLSKTIKLLKEQIAFIEKEIAAIVNNNQNLKTKSEVINSVKSIGDKTTAVLTICLPELSSANRRTISAIAGLAPYANDSGSKTGRRKTSIGRPAVKRALFLPAMTAIRRNYYQLGDFYNRLTAAGKPKKVAIVAAMRKLLIIINNRCKECKELNELTQNQRSLAVA